MFTWMKQRIKDMPIFQKMFVICILVTVTISVISGGITYVTASDIILKKTIAQTEETINQVSENYDSFMEMIANRLDYIAFNPTVQEELLNRRPEKNEEGYYGSTRTVKRLLCRCSRAIRWRILRSMERMGNSIFAQYAERKNRSWRMKMN